jgi:preprotein translocase subunit SecA
MDFVTTLINLKIVQEPTQEKGSTEISKINPKFIGRKISRNEPCPCGSGKKYKKCCGAL